MAKFQSKIYPCNEVALAACWLLGCKLACPVTLGHQFVHSLRQYVGENGCSLQQNIHSLAVIYSHFPFNLVSSSVSSTLVTPSLFWVERQSAKNYPRHTVFSLLNIAQRDPEISSIPFDWAIEGTAFHWIALVAETRHLNCLQLNVHELCLCLSPGIRLTLCSERVPFAKQ